MSIELRKSNSNEKTTTRVITGRATHRPGQEPMIAIALSDMEYVMRTARSARCTTRDREPGCTCCCHLKSAVSISPRTAHFSAAGGLSMHNIMNMSKTRLAIKITCSDNSLYRVTPVYAIVEPDEVLVLNIGRIEGMPKKDRLGILMIDYNGTGNAKDAFKRTDLRPVTINIPLLVKES
ncbi:unnamed protein product [Cylicocyclus nassatus]|uniref:Major sperm protein n=1 Tax=Cylicocyclus nassatus TaxID=53992 RepID=A0AA36GQW3_CYLNA|nr:unnamed protein product [Cylicocyclus nassatus]